MKHSPTPSCAPPVQRSSRELLPQRIYPLRTLGMALLGLPVVLLLYAHGASPTVWAWVLFCCCLWPQLARWMAGNGPHAYQREVRNLIVDSILLGSMIPMVHFDVLLTALMLTFPISDKVTSGTRGLLWQSLIGTTLAIGISAWIEGFRFQPQTSLTTIVACLPLMVVYTLGVSFTIRQMVHKVQQQNRLLDTLSRTDILTGLDNRRYWQEWADTLLLQRLPNKRAATLLMVDVDHFKHVNDSYGHVQGDDVLRAIATVLRTNCGVDGRVGRLGGDEFALVLRDTLEDATPVAERIRDAVQRLSFPNVPSLHCSVSIGMAETSDVTGELRQWLEAADHALYKAKRHGRNRVSRNDERRRPAPQKH